MKHDKPHWETVLVAMSLLFLLTAIIRMLVEALQGR